MEIERISDVRALLRLANRLLHEISIREDDGDIRDFLGPAITHLEQVQGLAGIIADRYIERLPRLD